MKKYWVGCLLFLLAGLTFTGSKVNADEYTGHGSADYIVTEDMVNNIVPADYKVNEKTQGKAREKKYNEYFLKDRLQTVNIEIEENNLNYLCQNAVDKPTVLAKSATIGDTTIENVGLKTKGDFTLYHTYKDNEYSDRFSFTINFGKFVRDEATGDKQNFYGLKKVSFNNFFFDKSMLKEFSSWNIISELGLPHSQFGLCRLYINGQYWGVYFMVESLDSSILEQYLNCGKKEISDYLLKPEYTDFKSETISEYPDALWEFDDDTYSDVEEMLPTVYDWVEKLNKLNAGQDFEGNEIDVNSEEYIALLNEIFDVDEVIKYFACHSFLCQTDDMFTTQKNFGLYVDEKGKAMLIPWDYDLSFGVYAPLEAEQTANYNVDCMYVPAWDGSAPVKANFKRYYKNYPLFNVFYQNDEMMEKYYAYMMDCCKIADLGGTIYSGKHYEPGYIVNKIETIQEELLAAAGEELSPRASYVNFASQPHGAMGGLPNMKKIVAMRALGVYLQLTGSDSWSGTNGCDMSRTGNGQPNNWLKSKGKISAASSMDGIFSTGVYNGSSPTLNMERVGVETEDYLIILSNLGINEKEAKNFKIYSYNMTGEARDGYTLNVPMGKSVDEKKLTVKVFDEENMLAMPEITIDGDFISFLAPKKGYLAIKNGAIDIQANYIFIIVIFAFIIVAAALSFVVIKIKKKSVGEKVQ